MSRIGSDAPSISHRRKATVVDAYVGKRMEARRREVGVTQASLAARIGITDKQLRKYIIGTNRVSAGNLYTIATVLRVPIGYFFEGLEDYLSDDQAAEHGLAAHPPTARSRPRAPKMGEADALLQAFQVLSPRRRQAFRKLVAAIATNTEDVDR